MLGNAKKDPLLMMLRRDTEEDSNVHNEYFKTKKYSHPLTERQYENKNRSGHKQAGGNKENYQSLQNTMTFKLNQQLQIQDSKNDLMSSLTDKDLQALIKTEVRKEIRNLHRPVKASPLKCQSVPISQPFSFKPMLAMPMISKYTNMSCSIVQGSPNQQQTSSILQGSTSINDRKALVTSSSVTDFNDRSQDSSQNRDVDDDKLHETHETGFNSERGRMRVSELRKKFQESSANKRVVVSPRRSELEETESYKNVISRDLIHARQCIRHKDKQLNSMKDRVEMLQDQIALKDERLNELYSKFGSIIQMNAQNYLIFLDFINSFKTMMDAMAVSKKSSERNASFALQNVFKKRRLPQLLSNYEDNYREIEKAVNECSIKPESLTMFNHFNHHSQINESLDDRQLELVVHDLRGEIELLKDKNDELMVTNKLYEEQLKQKLVTHHYSAGKQQDHPSQKQNGSMIKSFTQKQSKVSHSSKNSIRCDANVTATDLMQMVHLMALESEIKYVKH